MKRRLYRRVFQPLVILVFVSFALCFAAALYQPYAIPGTTPPNRVTARQVAFGVPLRAVVDEPVWLDWGISHTQMRGVEPAPYHY